MLRSYYGSNKLFLYCTVISIKNILVNWSKQKHSSDRQRRSTCDVWCACNNTDIITTPSYHSRDHSIEGNETLDNEMTSYNNPFHQLTTTYLLYGTLAIIYSALFLKIYNNTMIYTNRKKATNTNIILFRLHKPVSKKCARHKTFIRHSYFVRILQWSADYNVR